MEKIWRLRLNLTAIIILSVAALFVLQIKRTDFLPVEVTRLSVLNIADLPEPWPQIFASEHQIPLWIFLNINGAAIKYFVHEPENLNTRSAAVMASIIEVVTSSQYSVPDGNYLINMGDINRDDYPWPVLSFTASQRQVDANRAVLMPDNRALQGHDKRFALLDSFMDKYPWEKRANKIFWRGMATGGSKITNNYKHVPRLRFLQAVRDLKFVDAAITGYPKSLHPEFIASIKHQFPLSKLVPLEGALAYKYQMDVDGHSCSFERMAWILYSNSVLFKHRSSQVQWYYSKLIPWVHYVPVNPDFGNLADQYHWIEQHPEQAREIASNARKFAEEVFSSDAVLLALSQAMHRYQQVLNDRQNIASISD